MMQSSSLVLLTIVLLGCGGDSTATTDDAGTDAMSTDAVGSDAMPLASPGCGIARAPGWTCHNTQIQGVDRYYCVLIPADYDAMVPRRILFNFHGCGGTVPRTGGSNGQEAYNAGRFLLVAPKSAGSCWEAATSSVDVALVIAARAELEATYCVDRAQTFAEGFSSGGFMASALACRQTAGVRAAATAGGTTSCNMPMPLWMYHGSLDTTVPFATYGPPVRDGFVASNGCSMTTKEIPGASPPCVEYTGCNQRTVWCNTNEGHRWPSTAWMFGGTLDFFASYFGR